MSATVVRPETAAAAPELHRRVEIRCPACGYGGVVSHLPGRCPMCGGNAWSQLVLRPRPIPAPRWSS
jgi:rubrerythrin